MTSKRLGRLIVVVGIALAVLAVPWWWHAMEAKNLRVRAGWIHSGDTEQRAIELLGEPSDTFESSDGQTVLVYRTQMGDITRSWCRWLAEHVWSGTPVPGDEATLGVYLDKQRRVSRISADAP